jgi:uncharacterized Zn finger protein
MSWYGDWKPYVPVAKRRAKAASFAHRLAKREGRGLTPVKPEGRKIASSFWGQAWCDNLEHYSDFANRLPRGRTYIRNGSVIDLQIERGKVKAIVSGSEIYTVTVKIRTLAQAAWKRIKQDCSQSIDSLIDLLQGRLDQGIMQRLTERDNGLFPTPKEIEMDCTCPDYATLCKHVAATLYGVGTRLDAAPELLFTLRDVDHVELISQAIAADNLDRTLGTGNETALSGKDLGEIFGIDLAAGSGSADDDAVGGNAAEGRARKKPARRKRTAAAVVPAEVETESPSKVRRKSAGRPQPAPRKQPAPKKSTTRRSVNKPATAVVAPHKGAASRTPRRQKVG